MIDVCNYRYKPQSGFVIDTTSRSRNWSRKLSPFLLGPVTLWNGTISQNVENAWQFSKVYKHHLYEDGNPSIEWTIWNDNGIRDKFAHRYPVGKDAIPEYSWWENEKLSYIEARKRIYIPLYTKAVVQTKAFKILSTIAKRNDIWLRDFDGYNYRKLNMTLKDVVNCESRKMGHAFVLAMLLEDKIDEVLS